MNESFTLDFIGTLSSASDDNNTNRNMESTEVDISLADGDCQMIKNASDVQKTDSYDKQSMRYCKIETLLDHLNNPPIFQQGLFCNPVLTLDNFLITRSCGVLRF